MKARFEYRISEDDYAQGLQVLAQSVFAKSPNRHWQILQYLVLLIVVAGVSWAINPYSLDAIVLTLVLYCVGAFVMQARTVRRWRKLTYSADQSDVTLSASDDGLVAAQAAMERRYSWSALQRIHDLPKLVVLEFADWAAIPMPANLWDSGQERAEFLAWIRGHAANLEPSTAPPVFDRSHLLRLLGAVAIALQAMITIDKWVTGAFLDDCSCTFRYSRLGQLLGIAPLAAYAATMAIAWSGLKWLNGRSPRIALGLAAACMLLFVTAQAIPPLLQIVRFFDAH